MKATDPAIIYIINVSVCFGVVGVVSEVVAVLTSTVVLGEWLATKKRNFKSSTMMWVLH